MRVEQSMTFLLEVLKEAQRGNLAPAPMQRPYVWSRKDVTDFCDSVQDGLPIGAFTIWDARDQDISVPVSRLGPVPTQTASALILDGHNRLATCAWVMTTPPQLLEGLSDAEDAVWMGEEILVLDPAQGRARFATPADAHAAMLMTTAQAFDNRELRGWLNGAMLGGMSEPDIDAHLKLAEDFTNAFRGQRIVCTRIQNATPEEAKSVFLRVCKAGVPMSEEDFSRAIGWERDTPRL